MDKSWNCSDLQEESGVKRKYNSVTWPIFTQSTLNSLIKFSIAILVKGIWSCGYDCALHICFYASNCGGPLGRLLQLNRNWSFNEIFAGSCSFCLHSANCGIKKSKYSKHYHQATFQDQTLIAGGGTVLLQQIWPPVGSRIIGRRKLNRGWNFNMICNTRFTWIEKFQMTRRTDKPRGVACWI